MRTIRGDDVRIPREAREAVAGHEEVVVMNRDRPSMVIVNPDDLALLSGPARQGRPLGDALARLRSAPLPDADFGDDLEVVLASIGADQTDPWAPS